MLDPSEQKEFADVREKLTKRRLLSRVAAAKKRLASEMEPTDAKPSSRGRGRGRRGRGRGRGGRGRGWGRKGRGRGRIAAENTPPAVPPTPLPSAPAASSSSSGAAASLGEVDTVQEIKVSPVSPDHSFQLTRRGVELVCFQLFSLLT